VRTQIEIRKDRLQKLARNGVQRFHL
jgi:hypothetical protein